MAKLPLQVLGSLTYFISKAVLIMTRWRGRNRGEEKEEKDVDRREIEGKE